MFDYGRQPATWSYTDRRLPPGRRRRRGTTCRAPPHHATCASGSKAGGRWPAPCSRRATSASARCRGASTSRRPTTTRPTRALVWTAHHWQHWLARGRFPDHPWRRYLERSALTLKGLTFAPTGALLAARHHLAARDARAASATGTTATRGSATPCSPCGRCTRSGSTGRRTTSSGSSPTSPSATTSCRSCTASTAAGTSHEETLDHLSGYEGARPVRIGNGAYDQRQHDVWGAVLDSVYIHTRSVDRLDERLWPILKPGRSSRRSRTGASPTTASGRCGASRSTSHRRR